LSTAKDWYEYYTKISDKGIFEKFVNSDMEVSAPRDQQAHEVLGLMRYATNTGTMALTIIAALEYSFPDIEERTSLKIHLVGAMLREFQGGSILEEILHLLPSLKRLELIFIGLEIPKRTASEMGARIDQLECCPSCTSAGRTRSYGMFLGTYHDYVKTNHYEKPNLAVAFHTGFSQSMTAEWRPTIDLLSKAQYPTLFTTYNKNEMEEETTILNELRANFIQKAEVNKWKGMCPIFEVIEEKEDSVYYPNYYWYIVGPKSA
jgi:splicing suppressor protein 51